MYSQRWPQPAGQWELVSSHFMMCCRWPPWLQPWHQTKSPFTTWWHTAHMLAHCRHLRRRNGVRKSQERLLGGDREGMGLGGSAPFCWVLLPRRGTPERDPGEGPWRGTLERDPGEGPPSSHPHRSQIQPLLLMGRLQLLQLMCRVVEAWLRQLMARQVLSLITSLEMFQSWKRCSRSM